MGHYIILSSQYPDSMMLAVTPLFSKGPRYWKLSNLRGYYRVTKWKRLKWNAGRLALKPKHLNQNTTNIGNKTGGRERQAPTFLLNLCQGTDHNCYMGLGRFIVTVNLTGLQECQISKAYFWVRPGRSSGRALGDYVWSWPPSSPVPPYSFLPKCHELSRLPLPCPFTMMFLSRSQPTVDWHFQNHKPKEASSPLNCVCRVFCPSNQKADQYRDAKFVFRSKFTNLSE